MHKAKPRFIYMRQKISKVFVIETVEKFHVIWIFKDDDKPK